MPVDSLSFEVLAEPFHKAIVERQVRMRRAAMWAVREGGRVVQREARSRVPVVSGTLQKSIRPSRQLKYRAEEWSLMIGPRGFPAHLYAQKIERRTQYMRPGYDKVVSEMPRIAAESFYRVWGFNL